MTDRLAERALHGERSALARLITLIENDECDLSALLPLVHRRPPRALVIGITGPPGAGKSTFVGALLQRFLAEDRRVAVIAVDPSSPLSNGAVLGDRLRMAGPHSDPRLFIRSLAARGHLGGLSGKTGLVTDLLDAAGFDVVLIETVGVGQSEVAVASLATVTLVLLAPGFGDDVQGIKAGVLEIADLFVVNKGDLPEADTLVHHLRAIPPRPGRTQPVAVFRCSALTGEGLDQVLASLRELGDCKALMGPVDRSSRVLALARDIALHRVRSRLSAPDLERRSREILAAVSAGSATLAECAERLLLWALQDAPQATGDAASPGTIESRE